VRWFLVAMALGLRHGTAPDHVAAVSTFVGEEGHGVARSVAQALRIGLGHALGMAVLATGASLLLHRLPQAWTLSMGRLSGLWLLLMGGWILVDLAGGSRLCPKRPQSRTLPRLQRHPGIAWCVGLLFGVAISPGDLAIFTLAARFGRTLIVTAALLASFWAAMLAALAAVGASLGSAERRGPSLLRRWLAAVSGLFGVAVGVLLLAGGLA
jgi:hypothetical protein